jgi:hypothetical protein
MQFSFIEKSDQSCADLVSKSQFAAILGVAPSRVTQLIAAGLPVEAGGRINQVEGRRWYEQNISINRRKARPDGHTSPSGELQRIRAELASIDLERAKGNLIDRRAAEDAIFTRARSERDAHLAWAARVAPAIAQRIGSDPSKLFLELDRELRAHLAKLAETPLQDLPHDG